MRLTDFWSRMESVFGQHYARSWAADHVLGSLGGRTVVQAFDEGESAKRIWRAVVEEVEVPGPLR